jgi:hypothetical protein
MRFLTGAAGWDVVGGQKLSPVYSATWAATGVVHDAALSASFVALGLEIVREVRGPMRLWDFCRRLGHRLGMPPVPLSELCDAVKATLAEIDDDRLRVLAPGMPGAGYVYDSADPDSEPVRCSR